MSKKKNLIRTKFKNEVFKRDKGCKVCGEYIWGDNMDAHHITDRNEMPNGGYVKENGITLCKESKTNEESCHMKAEKFHISDGKEWVEGLHPDDLYKIIGSSKELAIKESEKI